ncbi:MAG TPA: GGDEF domain-containing protein [Clostridia bacterium]|nr:GGDEF domain-containing protein [Clostridia bacterium]
MQELDIVLDKLHIFEKLYDVMRIVDPIRKKVLELKGDQFFDADIPCYKLWKKRELCENCISIRAFNEDDAIYRLEHKEGHIYMFTGIPVIIHGKRLVVELLKEATKSLIMGIDKESQGSEAYTMIEYMNRIAIRDPLTDLYNRRYINERLPVDLLNASTRGEPLSIILADIDFFKNINDTYGHAIGDEILKEFAGQLKGYIREGKDWVARYGGEEFLICLSNTDTKGAKKVAERMRRGIEKKQFIIDGGAISLTCSFGVYMVYGGAEDMTVEDVVGLVDKRLYKAKRLGRNRVQ